METFLPIARRREGEEGGKLREEKQRKEQYTHRVNSNLPWEYCKREREFLLVNKGKTPYLQKEILFLNIKKKQKKRAFTLKKISQKGYF